MILPDGYHNVPRGKVATIVTFLEMRRKPDIPDLAPPDGWQLMRHEVPDRDWYLRLFRAVGDDWLWFGRTILGAKALDEILQNPKVHVFSLHKDGQDGALLELDFRQPGQCELAYFGVIPGLIGTGAGRYLMTCALNAAWRQPITRFHLHTCTMDSPQALPFYRRTGFVPYDQKVEIYDDPRVHMGYDRALAPHLPIYDP